MNGHAPANGRTPAQLSAPHRAKWQKELISFVRANSPFYREAWKDITDPAPSSIEALPITDTDAYWAANAHSPPQTFTMPFIDGTVMRSGGSTGTPKMVYLTRAEVKTIGMVNGHALAAGCGYIPGDRIAQMSHYGGLYGSFQLFNNALADMPIPHVTLPIGGNESTENKVKWMDELGATVLLSNPSTARQLADHLVRHGRTMDRIRLISYTGEAVTKGLRAAYTRAFPNATLYPSLYGSVDAGPIGIPPRPFRDVDEDVAPTYKVLAPLLVLEIMNEAGQPIYENGRKGTVVITHLIKRLQPMIRYPTGDVASWVDVENEIFRLHGRDSVGIKIVSAQLSFTELRDAVDATLGEGIAQGSQFVVRRAAGDTQELTFRIVAAAPPDATAVGEALDQTLRRSNMRWQKQRELGYIAPVRVEWISVDQLQLKPSGKVSDLVEDRF